MGSETAFPPPADNEVVDGSEELASSQSAWWGWPACVYADRAFAQEAESAKFITGQGAAWLVAPSAPGRNHGWRVRIGSMAVRPSSRWRGSLGGRQISTA